MKAVNIYESLSWIRLTFDSWEANNHISRIQTQCTTGDNSWWLLLLIHSIEHWTLNSQTIEDWLTKHSIEFQFNSINSWSFWKGFSISNGYLLSTWTFWNSLNLYVTIFCINELLCVYQLHWIRKVHFLRNWSLSIVIIKDEREKKKQQNLFNEK